MGILSDIAPFEYGLPYPDFREQQEQGIEFVLNSQKRFRCLCLPGGGGKTGLALTLAKYTGWRTLILTSTKGLQDQYVREGKGAGLVEIKGKANYQCADLVDTNCKHGCREKCRLKNGLGYTYESARDIARASDLVVSNYAYGVRTNMMPQAGLVLSKENGGPNPFELLVLDEGHLAADALANCMNCSIQEDVLVDAGVSYPKYEGQIRDWSGWAREASAAIKASYDRAVSGLNSWDKRIRMNRNRVDDLESLVESVETIAQMAESEWVVEMSQGTRHGRVWTFDCVWPGSRSEQYLFAGIPNVVVMSASLRPIALRQLGVATDKYDFKEWPRIFKAVNNPVYCWPALSDKTGEDGQPLTVKLNRNTDEEDWGKVIDNLDEFLKYWCEETGWKGIIHTGTYEVQRRVMEGSRYRHLMDGNTGSKDSGSAMDAAERHREAQGPAILASPSFSTGWDFPDDQCRFVVVIKMPYPNIATKVMRARDARDKMYIPNIVVQEIVQGSLRGTRNENDWCGVLVIDGNFPWYMKVHGGSLAPKYFQFQTVWSCPKPSKRFLLDQRNTGDSKGDSIGSPGGFDNPR